MDRCTFCGHLWRFHAMMATIPTIGTCEKCKMKPKDVRPYTIKAGQILGASRHSLEPKHPHCGCLVRENPGCGAVVHHGPGHQSHTHCDQDGEHVLHGADYRYGRATWRGMEASSDFFDQPPSVEDP